MNPDDMTHGDDGAQSDELNHELADDLDATIERIGELIGMESDEKMQTPFGPMSEAELLNLVRPSLWQWVASKEETALSAVALIHRSTGDLLDKHAPDRDAQELAEEAIEDA